MISGALEGTVCIEVSGHVAGPYAGSLLGDLGCEVIKVELPNGGDTHRGRNPKYEGYGPSFRALNRNKKSLTLNLRDKKARGILLQLVATADILLENFRPPTRTQLGLDYEDLAKVNPKLIHCSISGYGQSGPYRDKPGFDTIGQALSGMISLVTDLDDPKVAGVSFVDHAAGIFAAHGIMAALLARAKTQRGQFIDVSLLQVSIAFIESHVADYLNGGEAVSRDNFPKGRIYSLLDCDRKPFMVHLSGHNQAWEGLLRAAELDQLIGDPRFDTRKQRSDRHDEIVSILRAQFHEKPREYWLPDWTRTPFPTRRSTRSRGFRQSPDQAYGHSQADHSSPNGYQQPGWQSNQYVGYTAKVCSPGTVTRGTDRGDTGTTGLQGRNGQRVKGKWGSMNWFLVPGF